MDVDTVVALKSSFFLFSLCVFSVLQMTNTHTRQIGEALPVPGGPLLLPLNYHHGTLTSDPTAFDGVAAALQTPLAGLAMDRVLRRTVSE